MESNRVQKTGSVAVAIFHYLALFLIGATVVWSASHEYLVMVEQGYAKLKDILLLFIYLELGAMIGIYHSHPNGRATPSDTDLAQAWQIGKIWVIAALSVDTPLSLGAFLRTDTAFAAVPMIAEGTG